MNKASNSSFAGLEFAAGIPGTVGGAIRGNAGAFGKAVGDVLTQAVILTRKGQIKEVDRSYFRFGYRNSILKQSEDTVLSASFKLEKKNKRLVEKQIKEYLERRKKNLPWKEKSAGCYFKNIVRGSEKIPAGLLLDQIGAKGMQVGGIRVSDRHANILINVQHGKSSDVKKLSSILKNTIKTKFNINLMEEVVYIS
jgi:UDP-N-acetylmuramate dehydrogenase